jgi:hypothetical protein
MSQNAATVEVVVRRGLPAGDRARLPRTKLRRLAGFGGIGKAAATLSRFYPQLSDLKPDVLIAGVWSSVSASGRQFIALAVIRTGAG